MEQIIEFLREYADFFEEAEKKQEKKLELLTKGELTGIEETIVMQQALDKQIENIENRRLTLFEQLGYGKMTFQEVAAQAEGAEKKELQALYARLDSSLGNIRFLNQRCMKLAQSALVGMGVVLQGQTEASSGYQKMMQSSGSILQKKI